MSVHTQSQSYVVSLTLIMVLRHRRVSQGASLVSHQPTGPLPCPPHSSLPLLLGSQLRGDTQRCASTQSIEVKTYTTQQCTHRMSKSSTHCMSVGVVSYSSWQVSAHLSYTQCGRQFSRRYARGLTVPQCAVYPSPGALISFFLH